MPLSMSRTIFCAARPRAIPATPAEASSGARLTPTAARNCRLTMAPMMAMPVVRMTPASVFTCEMRAGPWRVLLGDVDHSGRHQAQQAAENKADQRYHEQVRQLVADELLGIDAPPVQHAAQKPPFRKPARSCRQQKHE